MNENEKRSRGPECISEEEYEEICREEDKKMLDSTFVEPNTIDEIERPSIDIISECCFDDNDYDFEVEEKETELTPMQRFRQSNKLDLIDEVVYTGNLEKISSTNSIDTGFGVLSFTYGINLDDKVKQVEDPFFFNINNSRSFEVNLDRLERVLNKYGVTLSDEDYKDVKSIEMALQHLVGRKVSLTQKTKNNYKNYKIVNVLD